MKLWHVGLAMSALYVSGAAALEPAESSSDAAAVQAVPSTAPATAGDVAAAPLAPDVGTPKLDGWHDLLYQSVEQFLEEADRRFAARDGEALPTVASPFRVHLGANYVAHPIATGPTVDGAVDVSLHLPNLEKRLRLFLTSASIGEEPDTVNPDNALRAGLSGTLLRHLRVELGVKAGLRPDPFAAVSWQGHQKWGALELYPSAKVFAQSSQGRGASATATLDHWNQLTLLRVAGFAEWRERLQATEWSESLIGARVAELIQPNRSPLRLTGDDLGAGLGVRLLAGGADTARADYLELSVFFKRSVRHPWLVGSVAPLLRWQRDHDWRGGLGLRVGFDVFFTGQDAKLGGHGS